MLKSFDIFTMEHGATIIFVNIFSYFIVITFIFCLIFSFNSKIFNSLSDFKYFNIFSYAQLAFILSILALSGMPPFIGFVGKFLAIILLIKNFHYYSLCIFFIINAFALYFYIIILRFSTYQSISAYFLNNTYNFYINTFNIIIIIYLFIFISFNFFFYHDIYNFFYMIFTYK
jgi:NADH:ubiquinone oxidoreductase subunit 2 (subunit N)